MSESTTQTVLDKLLPDTRYRVTVVPVYAEGDGLSLSDVGKTSKAAWRLESAECEAAGADVV